MTTEREAEYIFYMACAVVGKVNVPFPNVRPDWQKIYEISAYHRIENIVAYAVEQLCLKKGYCSCSGKISGSRNFRRVGNVKMPFY